MNKLEQILKESISSLPGALGVFYKNLLTNETIYTGNDIFQSASVIKLWVMAEAFNQLEEGIINTEDTFILNESDKVPSSTLINYHQNFLDNNLSDDMFPESGVLNCLHNGLKLTIEDLINLMIQISDNTATNILIDILGLENINQYITSLGYKHTILGRKLFDSDASKNNVENLISIRETGDFLEKIYNHTAISYDASTKMSQILQNQQITYKIPFFLRNIPIAHKTGEDNGIANDVGIVYGNNPFIFCFASNNTIVSKAERMCQDLALEAYNYSN